MRNPTVATFIVLVSACSPSPMKHQVQAVLESNEKAKTLAEWKASGVTPEQVFEKAETAQAQQELCQALGELKPQDLALFDHQISHEKALPCQAMLMAQLEQHWIEASEKFGSQFKATSKQLPVLEKEVDVSGTGPVLVRGDIPNGHIALTLDDGPHPTRTQRLLEIFAQHGVRATYFMVGENARDMPDVARAVADAGHTVGSHSWSHKQLTKIPMSAAQDEILNGADAVGVASGGYVPFFRFPYGARNPALTAYVKKIPMASFLWNMDSVDWKYRDPEVLWSKIVTALDREKGGIMLFHDIHEQTVIVMPRLMEELKARGFTVVVYVPKNERR